jgi:HD-GYP domain-containing protein (c-di-GMP phosphodiesterase class II)
VFRHRPALLVLMGAAAILPGAALEAFGTRAAGLGGPQHFAIVAVAALVAAIASAGLTRAGVRRRDGRTALIGIAFSTMTAMLAVHGLATPGVLFGPNGVVAAAGGASLPAGAAVLALTALPGLRSTRRMAPLLALQTALAGGIVTLGLVGLLWPSLVPAVPAAGSAEAKALLTVGVALFGLLTNRALRTFALTRRPSDLVVAVGCAWLAMASVATLTSVPGTLGFYIGHALELAGVVLLVVPAALDLRRGGASRPLVGDLTPAELVASEEAYLGARVRALMVRLGEHDGSTEGHARRVALLAVQVGEALGLPAATLRHLAVGGLLHDIGKLSVPGAILRKPEPLTDGEYDDVKRHPDAGRRLLRELGGFPAAVHRLVGEHHERLDGAGYPAGLRAEQLEIGPRILAVCDVYDALVSDRVYRHAWSPERALALLRAETGSAFDARCVESLATVLGHGVPAPAPARAGLSAPSPATA